MKFTHQSRVMKHQEKTPKDSGDEAGKSCGFVAVEGQEKQEVSPGIFCKIYSTAKRAEAGST